MLRLTKCQNFLFVSTLIWCCSIHVQIALFASLKFMELLYFGPEHSWASASRKLTPASRKLTPASRSLVRYRTKKMPDCDSLVRYRTCPGIVNSIHSGTGLTKCWTVRHFCIYVHAHRHATCNINMQHGQSHGPKTWVCSLDTDMQNGHGHAAFTLTCSMETDMLHVHGHAAWTRTWACIMDMGIHHGQGHAAWTLTWTCSMDREMQRGHGHTTRIWSCSKDLLMQYGSGQWTCMDAGMPIKSSVWHR
jgi:hypothetical protein